MTANETLTSFFFCSIGVINIGKRITEDGENYGNIKKFLNKGEY